MAGFKQGELYIAQGAQMLSQGVVSPHLYTVLQGVLFRFKTMEDGRRQIVNFLFPGDMVGLQGAMEDPLQHGVEAITEARVCISQRERFPGAVRRAIRASNRRGFAFHAHRKPQWTST